MTNRRMRNTRDAGASRNIILIILTTLIILSAVGIGLYAAFSALSGIWLQQYIVKEREIDVVITSGKMVHPDVITMHFGLTNGANLAHIPYADLRNDLLNRVPNIKDIKIERRLPNRVTIDVIEREPIARIAPPNGRIETGRVADVDGVVFRFSSNTSLLPIIRESVEPVTPPGKKLSGFAAAALRLIDAASHPDLADLRILEVDISHKDYLLVTLGNYDRVRLAWNCMEEDSRLSRESLTKQLKRVAKAIKINITPQRTLWIATDWGSPGRVYAGGVSGTGNK